MRFDSLLAAVSPLPYFDLAMVAQLFDDDRATLRTQLHRWTKAGKLLPLKRGMYALAEPYRRASVNPAALANDLHKPSYLSGVWTLGYCGLIPERVVTYTSVTTRGPTEVTNAFGRFQYSAVKRPAFFGYVATEIGGAKVLLAEPEKALLDHWHLSPGEWTTDRLRERRYQNLELVTAARLFAYAERFESSRLVRAAERWVRLAESAQDRGVEL